MSADAVFLVAGAALLLGVVLPAVLSRAALSAPIVLVAAGALVGALPMPDGVVVSPLRHPAWAEHLTEVCVIVALMGVGLSLDRPLDVRRLSSWRTWGATWRLLAFGIPLTTAAVALSGWWLLGLAPAAALLLGAALSPTDPVLASDVQVAGPTEQSPARGDGGGGAGAEDSTKEEDLVDEDDEVRFALTSEAGLNDGLGFPFIYLAILGTTVAGFSVGGVVQWFAWDLIARVLIGVVVGAGSGWVLARVAFRAPRRSLRLAETGEPLLALAATLLAYGLAEVAGGYGFLAVFCCAVAMRSAERDERGHGYHADMHEVVERLERLLTLIVLLLLGVAMTQGLLGRLTWPGALVAVLLVLVIRPLVAWVVLHPSLPPGPGRVAGRLRPRERAATAFFGVRGVGSLYYLSYGLTHGDFGDPGPLWSTVAFTVVLSVAVHGITATPVMRWLDELREPENAESFARP